MGAGNHSMRPSDNLNHDFEKSHFGSMAVRLRASVRQTVGTGVCARPWRTRRAPHIRPASIIRNGMAVCVQKHEIQKGPLTHPTNPEVAACRAPVFGLRFVVSIIGVYREHYQGVFRFFRSLFLCQELLGAKNVPSVF